MKSFPPLSSIPSCWNYFAERRNKRIRPAYYDLIQFKILLRTDDGEIDLADGGPVDWTQRLLSNRKHRLIISGIGTELVHKLR